MRHLVTWALLALGVMAASAGSYAATPSPAAQLTAYLKATHTAVSRLSNDESNVAFAASQWNSDEKAIDANELDATFHHLEAPQLIGDKTFYKKAVMAAYADAQHQAPVLARVKAPQAMHGPQAHLAAAAKAFAVRLGKAEKSISAAPDVDPDYDNAAGPLSVTNVGIAVTDGEIAAGTYQGDEKDWRQELIVQLRRAQVTVPPWVKQVGTT